MDGWFPSKGGLEGGGGGGGWLRRCGYSWRGNHSPRSEGARTVHLRSSAEQRRADLHGKVNH